MFYCSVGRAFAGGLEVLKQEAENVTTLLLSMVAQTVKEGARKGELVILTHVQVTF